MALPLSRNVTYVSGTTPYIAAATENDIQNYIVHAFQGTRTIRSLSVDGSSDNVPTNAPGTIQITTSGSSTTPGASTVQPGTGWRESFVHGFCSADETGALRRGYNLRSVTKNGGNGDYTVIFDSAVLEPANACVQITPYGVATVTVFATIIAIANDGGGRVSVNFQMHDDGGILINSGFCVTAWAY